MEPTLDIHLMPLQHAIRSLVGRLSDTELISDDRQRLIAALQNALLALAQYRRAQELEEKAWELVAQELSSAQSRSVSEQNPC